MTKEFSFSYKGLTVNVAPEKKDDGIEMGAWNYWIDNSVESKTIHNGFGHSTYKYAAISAKKFIDTYIKAAPVVIDFKVLAEEIYKNHRLFPTVNDAYKAQRLESQSYTRGNKRKEFWEAEAPTLSAGDAGGLIDGSREPLDGGRLTKDSIISLIETMLRKFNGELPRGFEIFIEQDIIYYGGMRDKFAGAGVPSGDVACTKLLKY